MADKPVDQVSKDEKVAQAKELLAVANRNYYVKAYSDAVDDFSTACSIYSDVYGPTADELAVPYLMYAKCLVALGQDENKVMDVPEEGEDNDDDGEAEDAADDDDGPEADNNGAGTSSSEKEVEEQAPSAAASASIVDDAQPGSSTGITESAVDDEEVKEEDDDDVANLQVAWEVLELAVSIFTRQPNQAKNLADCFMELAGISFENSNFEAAIKDFTKALAILQDLTEPDNREFAEVHYKVGLAYIMLEQFEEAKVSLQKACEHLDEVIRIEKSREQTDDIINSIKDLEEMKQEILNKVAEVNDYEQQSMDEVKREISKLVGNSETFGASEAESSLSGAGGSSSSTATEAKEVKPAVDISHLIKRKSRSEDAATSAKASDATSFMKASEEANDLEFSSVGSKRSQPSEAVDISHLIKRKK